MKKHKFRQAGIYAISSLVFLIFSFYGCQSSEFIKSQTLEPPGQCHLTSKGYFRGLLIGADSKAYVFTFDLTDYKSAEPDAYFSSIYAVEEGCRYKKIYEIDEKFNGPECLAMGTDNNIYFVLGDLKISKSYLYSLSTKGDLNWKIDLEGSSNCEEFAIGSDGTIYAEIASNLYAVSSAGEIKWSLPLVRLEGPYIGAGDNIFIAHSYGTTRYLSSISKDGETNWDYDFGSETPQRMAIGPSGNIYLTSSTKGDIVYVYLYSISQDGELNWKVLLGVGTQLEISGRGGLLIGEDETIYKSGDLKSLLAFNPVDGLAKWFKEGIGNGNVDFIDGQGNIYYLNLDEGNKEEIFDQDGNFISSVGPEGVFSLWSLINGNYFYNFNYHNFFIYQALGSGYAKSAWPMKYHDPQRTNRWNGGF